MKISCIIVEDEPLAAERLKSYVQKLQELELVAVFDNGLDALNFLKSNPVDLLFLDINLGEISGIRMLETFNIPAQVILTTAYHEYALKGYELNICDYLLKPFTFERFIQAVEKVKQRHVSPDAGVQRKFIFVKTEYRLEKILLSDILYIEGMRDYRRIHTVDKRIMTLQTFKDFEKEVSPDVLCRVHKSFMVSVERIDAVEKDEIRIGERFIPISETYKKEFLERIKG